MFLHLFELLFLLTLFFLFTLSVVLTLYHTISYHKYESILAGDDIVNVAVVIKDKMTKERVLAAEEFSISAAHLTTEVQQLSTSLQLPTAPYSSLQLKSYD